MLGVRVSVPVACFRKGLAREYLETELLPPPSTCYGFLLSLVGEVSRRRHVGVRVCPMLLGQPEHSVVLRTVWRVKNKPLGAPGNTRPDYQQLLTGIDLVIWLDSADEVSQDHLLESRVRAALDPRQRAGIVRFGGLSLGESTHLVDQVDSLDLCRHRDALAGRTGQAFFTQPNGRMTLPVWVDHVGSSGTRHAVGDLLVHPVIKPPEDRKLMPLIAPPEYRP